MSIIKDPEYLPVFHHIAKNAGTYVLSWAQMLCRKYHMMIENNQAQCWTGNRIRRFLVKLEDQKELTVFYYTSTDLTGSRNGILQFKDCFNSNGEIDKVKLVNAQNEFISSKFNQVSELDPFTNIIDENCLLDLIKSGDVEVFSISINPHSPGWNPARVYIQKILDESKIKHALHFTVLRDPYKRAQSLFHYLTGNESAHEPTHGSIKAKNFEDYIQSNEVEDSWFLRSLLDMPDDEIIEPYHLTLAHEWLHHFRISDTSKVDDLINHVFHGAYGILQSDVEPDVVKWHVDKNSTPNKLKIKFEDLDSTIQQKFLDRTYWDRKLWERYCKNADIS